VEVVEHKLFEPPHLFGEVGIGEEDGRIGEIDHKL
jgi:hypothetical protein